MDVVVCTGRAIADGRIAVPAFSDPTAMQLLFPELQAEVKRIRQEPRPKEWRARFRYEHLTRESHLVAARTVAIDAELRSAAVPQVVILGAGLDGRAWRMRELEASVVFEVDHPDEKGAFTGAMQQRRGRFETAHSGTIFLDEIGEVPVETQLALLRVLEERQFERVGGSRAISVDVRIIAATNRDLSSAIAAGTFRSDLFGDQRESCWLEGRCG